jgi:NAD(P)-dependent dehydrogenase (short-subunit alcohol dehydrogenase family)
VDLYDPDAVANLCNEIPAQRAPLRCLVNAAGTFLPTAFLDHLPEDYDRYLALNHSTFFLTQGAARNMKVHGGAIVNVGSMWPHDRSGKVPCPWGTLPYDDRYRNLYMLFTRMRHITATQFVSSRLIVELNTNAPDQIPEEQKEEPSPHLRQIQVRLTT